jgi:hypothetical protein
MLLFGRAGPLNAAFAVIVLILLVDVVYLQQKDVSSV